MQVTPSNAILLRLSVTQFAEPLIIQQPLLLLPLLPFAAPPFPLSPSKLLVALGTDPHRPLIPLKQSMQSLSFYCVCALQILSSLALPLLVMVDIKTNYQQVCFGV